MSDPFSNLRDMAHQLELASAAPPADSHGVASRPSFPRTSPLPHGVAGRVVVSDAFALLDGLADESVDLVLTDPPYESLQLHRSRGTTTRLTSDWFQTIPDSRLPELLESAFAMVEVGRDALAAEKSKRAAAAEAELSGEVK